jgi:dihydroxy-acid dehydratase
MGTEASTRSSPEVISDCTETRVQGQWMDGVLVVAHCTKNMLAQIACCGAIVPAIYVYGGTICRACTKART